MIDTIVLVLKQGMFTILEPDRFEPSARWLKDDQLSLGGRGYIPSKQNPTPSELKSGIYKPRLTLTKRMNGYRNYEITLKIEFSLPKLIYGNNFDELEDKDFAVIVEKLRLILKDMGVLVFSEKIDEALVSAVHYSKNIPLTDGSTPYQYIKKIAEANVKLSLDVNQTDFRNEGHSIKWHCNSYEVTFYDKLKDLRAAKTSEKRAIERDNVIQQNLFDTLSEKKPFEVIRMEVRLGKRQKIRQILKSIGINSEPTFHTLFSSKLSQTILLCYLHEMESRRPSLLDFPSNKPKELLAELAINNPSLSPKRILQIFGLKQALELFGMREVRTIFNKYSDRSWYRLVADTNKIKLPVKKDVFGIIRKHLSDFEPLRLADHKIDMSNSNQNDVI